MANVKVRVPISAIASSAKEVLSHGIPWQIQGLGALSIAIIAAGCTPTPVNQNEGQHLASGYEIAQQIKDGIAIAPHFVDPKTNYTPEQIAILEEPYPGFHIEGVYNWVGIDPNKKLDPINATPEQYDVTFQTYNFVDDLGNRKNYVVFPGAKNDYSDVESLHKVEFFSGWEPGQNGELSFVYFIKNDRGEAISFFSVNWNNITDQDLAFIRSSPSLVEIMNKADNVSMFNPLTEQELTTKIEPQKSSSAKLLELVGKIIEPDMVAHAAAAPTSTNLPENTPTPTPSAVTMTELGITDPNSDLAKAFSGVEKTVTLEADGSFSVQAKTYEGEKIVQQKYILELDTFNANLDIKDELTRPLEVKAFKIDDQGNKTEVTLLWQGEKGWHEEFDMSKSDDPTFSKIDQHIYFERSDILTLLQSARAYFRDHPPFGQAAFDNFMRTEQNSLVLEYQNDGKIATLQSPSNNIGNHTPETATGKFLTIWVRTKNFDGDIIDAPLIGFIDPPNLKNMTPDDFKIFVDIGDNVDGFNGIQLDTRSKDYLKMIANQYYGPDQNPPVPEIVLYADEVMQKNDPLLEKFFKFFHKETDTYLNSLGMWGYQIRGTFGMLPEPDQSLFPIRSGPENQTISLNFRGIPIPSEFQEMFFFTRITVAKP